MRASPPLPTSVDPTPITDKFGAGSSLESAFGFHSWTTWHERPLERAGGLAYDDGDDYSVFALYPQCFIPGAAEHCCQLQWAARGRGAPFSCWQILGDDAVAILPQPALLSLRVALVETMMHVARRCSAKTGADRRQSIGLNSCCIYLCILPLTAMTCLCVYTNVYVSR